MDIYNNYSPPAPPPSEKAPCVLLLGGVGLEHTRPRIKNTAPIGLGETASLVRKRAVLYIIAANSKLCTFIAFGYFLVMFWFLFGLPLVRTWLCFGYWQASECIY